MNGLTATSSERAHAFERVYAEDRWLRGRDGALCASGWSAVSAGQGAAAMHAVVRVVRTMGIRSIADVPCGDGCFAGALLSTLRNTTGNTIDYIGVDIVGHLIERNRARLGDETTRFLQLDVASGTVPLPRADLIFSRQMMQHLCNDDVLRFLRLIGHSSARYALLTTFKTDDAFINADIGCASGDYRPQDLTKPPFSLPAPLALFDEEYPLDTRVALGLWSVRTLRYRLRMR